MTFAVLARPPHPTAPAAATLWKMLFDRQQALLHRRAGPGFGAALAALGLRRDALPHLPTLAHALAERTGWRLRLTATAPDEPTYYAALARRELPVVSRLRTYAEFDRPGGGPDLFADLFGRVPLLLEPGYAQALAALGQAGALAATPAAAALLRRFAQATFERGLLAAPTGPVPTLYGAALLTSAHALHAAAAAEPRPLAGAVRLLSSLPAEAPLPYFVASSWTELQAEVAELARGLVRPTRPVWAPGWVEGLARRAA